MMTDLQKATSNARVFGIQMAIFFSWYPEGRGMEWKVKPSGFPAAAAATSP